MRALRLTVTRGRAPPTGTTTVRSMIRHLAGQWTGPGLCQGSLRFSDNGAIPLNHTRSPIIVRSHEVN